MPPRSKKGGKRGSFQNTPPPPRGPRRGPALDPDFLPFAGTSSPRRGQHGFTLQEEARNTERQQSFWNTDQKLRHSKITFVSAGTFEQTKEEMPQMEEPDTEMASLSLQDLDNEDREAIGVIEGAEDEDGEEEQADSGGDQHTESANGPSQQATFDFIVDTQGSEPVQTALPPPRLRSASLTPSNSSEEVILFRGRDKPGRALSGRPSSTKPPSREPKSRESQSSIPANLFDARIQVIEDEIYEQPREHHLRERPSRRPTDPFDARIRIVENEIHKQEELLQEVLRQKASSAPAHQSLAEISMAEVDFLPQAETRSIHRSRRVKRRAATEEEEEEEALIADYIENMDQEDVNVLNSFGARELGGTEDELWQETEASSGEPSGNAKQPASKYDWNRDDILDFDDLSTSDEVRGEVQAIISKRVRQNGLQYLVIWESMTADEARWVPDSSLSTISAWRHIELFEAEEKLVAEFGEAGDEDTSDTEDMDEDDADEADLLQRKQERMSDERIARLLAKQEELGMGSSELMLLDDDEDANEEELVVPKTSFGPATFSPTISRANGKGSKRPRGEFPSATFLADAYDGFDVMDFERPSLQKKFKGRKGKLVFDISDSELEASMQMAWENDRSKKKERKQERGELRAQGLLGSKNAKPDLKQKYKEGMGIHAVKEEIKAFLMSNNTTLTLPPMDKADRKIVHEFANAFNLKSKSVGNGTNRSPNLYRTSVTAMQFKPQAFDALVDKLSKRYLPSKRAPGSHKWTNPNLKKPGEGGRGGGFNSAAASYRDGDVVGGSAPELGAENKGRAMLEKMGWSQGTALGAMNNKGIMQPVTHVVKTTKAGLG